MEQTLMVALPVEGCVCLRFRQGISTLLVSIGITEAVVARIRKVCCWCWSCGAMHAIDPVAGFPSTTTCHQ